MRRRATVSELRLASLLVRRGLRAFRVVRSQEHRIVRYERGGSDVRS